MLVHALVTGRIDDWLLTNSLLYGLPHLQLSKLQRVQNTAARLLCNLSRFDHISLALFRVLEYPKDRTKRTLGDSAFCGAAPKLWHILPNNIRNSRTYDIFKVLLKTHLFKEVFL